MSDSSRNSSIGLCGATFLVFLILRLTDHIDWAWYWVASPLWVPAVTVLAAVAVVAAVAFPCMLISDTLKDRRRLAKFREKHGVPKL